MSFGFKYAQRKRTLVTVSSQMIERIIDWTLWMIERTLVAVNSQMIERMTDWTLWMILGFEYA